MKLLTASSRIILLNFCFFVGFDVLRAAEVNVQVKYPSQSNDLILTGILDDAIVLRPKGRDNGGRAYLSISELERQRVVLNFLFSQAYYTAVEDLEKGQFASALPVIEQAATPLMDYLSLSVLPGNLLPTVLSYLDALRGVKRWDAAVTVATRIPLAIAPPLALDYVGELALDLHAAGEIAALERVHAHIINTRELSVDRLEITMDLADQWRERGEFLRAFQLYRKIQIIEGPQQILARLWVAYCSFYLGHDLVPEVFLEVLPEMEAGGNGFSLRELIKARLRLREEAYDAALRSAAEGKIYANATDPWYPELLYTVGRLYQQRGMNDAARAAYREVTILFAESPWATESSKALESLNPDVSTL